MQGQKDLSADPLQDAQSLAAFQSVRRRSLPLVVEELEFRENDKRSGCLGRRPSESSTDI